MNNCIPDKNKLKKQAEAQGFIRFRQNFQFQYFQNMKSDKWGMRNSNVCWITMYEAIYL